MKEMIKSEMEEVEESGDMSEITCLLVRISITCNSFESMAPSEMMNLLGEWKHKLTMIFKHKNTQKVYMRSSNNKIDHVLQMN